MKKTARFKDASVFAPQAHFFCSECGKRAAILVLVPSGQPDPRLTPEPAGVPPGIHMLGSEFARLSIDSGPASSTIMVAAAHVESVKKALVAEDAGALFDVNYEYAPFWCPMCRRSYCREHYAAIPTFDDGFFDAMYGVCPRGHRRKLDD